MKHYVRDLWVLLNQDLMNEQALQKEMHRLNTMLQQVERTDHIAHACELIDLNQYRIQRKAHFVRDYLRARKDIPFVFVNNCN